MLCSAPRHVLYINLSCLRLNSRRFATISAAVFIKRIRISISNKHIGQSYASVVQGSVPNRRRSNDTLMQAITSRNVTSQMFQPCVILRATYLLLQQQTTQLVCMLAAVGSLLGKHKVRKFYVTSSSTS